MNTKNLLAGIFFECMAGLCVFSIITRGATILTALGATLFFLLGIAYLKRAKEY